MGSGRDVPFASCVTPERTLVVTVSARIRSRLLSSAAGSLIGDGCGRGGTSDLSPGDFTVGFPSEGIRRSPIPGGFAGSGSGLTHVGIEFARGKGGRTWIGSIRSIQIKSYKVRSNTKILDGHFAKRESTSFGKLRFFLAILPGWRTGRNTLTQALKSLANTVNISSYKQKSDKGKDLDMQTCGGFMIDADCFPSWI